MPSFASWLAPARRSLADHLGRLGRSFDSLAEQVREAVARAIGRTVAEAVSEAVDAALAPAEGQPDCYSPARPSYSPGRPSRLWDDPDGARWDRQPEDYDPYRRPYDDPDDPDPYANDPREEPADTPQPRRRLGRALAAGLQAAGWWMQRPGRVSVLAAVGVGLVAGTAALVRGTAAGPAGLVGAALSLLALDGLVRSVSDLTGQAATP
jgi:hypothetical protein